MWRSENNLQLDVPKMKENVIDFRRKKTLILLVINDTKMDMVDTFKLLGIHISHDLTWEERISHIKK